LVGGSIPLTPANIDKFKMINFIKSVFDEAKKLQTPTKKETYITVVTILISITIASIVVMFSDFIISKVVKILFGLGS
jgi:preprotein translocase SecE subunit